MKKDMEENFKKLDDRLFDGLYRTDLEKIRYELKKINEPILVTGVGGSSVVANYAAGILNKKNNIITRCVEPRDFKYLNTNGYKSVMACSYSGNTSGIKLAFSNDMKHYLFAGRESESDNVTSLTYNCNDKEHSFISLASTLIPCGVLLSYYYDNIRDYIDYVIDNTDPYTFDFDVNCSVFEIFSGLETSTASKYLESTMVEAGIGIPVIHDKYSYCHGRSTLSTTNNSIAIYFNLNTELDKLLVNELPKYYKEVIVLNANCSPMSEYFLLVKCIYLTKYIAERKHKDLSGIDYCPIVRKIYDFKGSV